MNDILIAPFKHPSGFALSTLRMQGDTLNEEIMMADDKPSVDNKIVSLRAQSMHFIKMTRLVNQG
jgi:hypothetical protein